MKSQIFGGIYVQEQGHSIPSVANKYVLLYLGLVYRNYYYYYFVCFFICIMCFSSSAYL
jgi:hypothetical protein